MRSRHGAGRSLRRQGGLRAADGPRPHSKAIRPCLQSRSSIGAQSIAGMAKRDEAPAPYPAVRRHHGSFAMENSGAGICTPERISAQQARN